MTQEISTYKFPLVNVVKYAKSHYKKTGSFWYDIVLCLQTDDYGPFFRYTETRKTPQEECFQHRMDITKLLVGKISKIIKDYRSDEMLEHISPQGCWKVGYSCKNSWLATPKERETLPEYEYWEAVARTYVAELTMTTAAELGYENWQQFEGCNIPELKKEEDPSTIKTV